LLALKLLGAEGPIPDAPARELVRKLDMSNDGNAWFIWDLGRLARERGATEIQKLLDRRLKEYTVRRAVRQFKRLFRPRRVKPGEIKLGRPVLF
jgi:hypothetical protein